MARVGTVIRVLGILVVAAVGCGPTPECGAPGAGNLLPLSVGSTWVYDESGGPLPGTITKTVKGTEVFEDRVTFVWETVQTNSAVTKTANWLDDGERVVRLRQTRWQDGQVLTSRTYRPGFLRLDRSLDEVGESLTESHVRSELDAAGNLIGAVNKRFEWTVEAVESITVAAGVFEAVRVRRVDLDGGEVKTYWYARGVGKVLETGPLETEELTEFELR